MVVSEQNISIDRIVSRAFDALFPARCALAALTEDPS